MTDDLGDFVEAIVGAPKGSVDTWIERVRAADAEAEEAFARAVRTNDLGHTNVSVALIAIAAELRAARIARRPGAGQT